MLGFILGLFLGAYIGGIIVAVGLREISRRNAILQRQINAKIDELHE